MRTLVYIASGSYRTEYEALDYDRIYLVDTHIKTNFSSKKVIPLKMDALDSVYYFGKHNIKIDCLVCLCESRGEGGQTYAMCSDVFMGFFMTVLPKHFIWITNDSSYYGFSHYKKGNPTYIPVYDKDNCRIIRNYPKMSSMYGMNYVSLDLPYQMRELGDADNEYINPRTFSDLLDNTNSGHVFEMKYDPFVDVVRINEKMTVRFIQDSIWNHLKELDHIFISFKLEDSRCRDYFENIDRVGYYKQMEFYDKLVNASIKGEKHIGFTPHYWYQYDFNYGTQLTRFVNANDTNMTIDFYYLSSWFSIKHLRKAIRHIKRMKTSHHVKE